MEDRFAAGATSPRLRASAQTKSPHPLREYPLARSDHARAHGQSVAVRRAGEEAAFLEGAGEVPRAGRVGGEAAEAAIIFGVADHHQRGVGPRLGRGEHIDRKSVVSGKSVSVRVDLGGRSIIQKK